MLPNKTFIIDVEVSYGTKAPSYYLKLMLDCFRGVSTPRIWSYFLIKAFCPSL
jgi:hypothetical protein